jgi:hypothetical protein
MTNYPLLNRPPPYPDESLASWLWRLARHNYLVSSSLLMCYLRDSGVNILPSQIHRLNKVQDDALLAGIAGLAATSGDEIRQHTIHRFARVLILRSGLKSGNIPDILQPKQSDKDFFAPRFTWCPICLKQARYVRLHWHVPLVVCCEKHNCWLYEECPCCQNRLREDDILQGQCAQCGYDLEDAGVVPVDDEILLMQATVMAWLYNQPVGMDLNLPDVPVATLLRIMQGLRYSAQRAGNDWDFHYVAPEIPRPNLDIVKRRLLTVFERGCLYVTAFRGLQNWPHGFISFLDAYRNRPAEKEPSGFRREFGVLYISWLMRFWKYPAFDFIQEVFNDYLIERMPVYQMMLSKRVKDYPELADRLEYLDMGRSRKYLKSSVLSIYRLANEGHLTIHRFEEDARCVWLSRQEMDDLQERWQRYVRLFDLKRILGLSPRLIHELIDAGWLSVVPANVGLKQQGLYVYQDSLNNFIGQLKKRVLTHVNVPERSILLLDVCICNGGSVKLDLVQLLARVFAGKVSAYHPNETLLPLNAMWFEAEDVENLSETMKTEQDWINLTETPAYLEVGRRVFGHLLDTGLLQPQQRFGNKQLFRKRDVLALRERCITSAQTARLLSIPIAYISSLVRLGSLKPISGPGVNQHGHYLFDRQNILAWKRQYVMYNEMKTMTTDIVALMRLLKQRGIQSVVGRPHVYVRKEVVEAITNNID